MAGSSGDRHADRGAAPTLSLRRLAAVPPSFDQALDDLIARAHETERSVGDDDVIASEDSSDSLTDPFPTDPLFDPARSDASLDATTDPYADPTRGPRRADRDEEAEAYQLALRGQLAGLQRRVAVAEAHEPAMREQLADLQRRLAAAEARQAAPTSQRRIWLVVALAFAAGLAARFGLARFGDHPASPPRSDPAAMDDLGPGAARPGEPIVTPIDPPPVADPSSGLPSGPARGQPRPSPAAAAPRKTGSGPAGAPATPSTNPRPASDAVGSAGSASAGGLVDPFAESSGGSAPPPAEAVPRDAGPIVDPFGNR